MTIGRYASNESDVGHASKLGQSDRDVFDDRTALLRPRPRPMPLVFETKVKLRPKVFELKAKPIYLEAKATRLRGQGHQNLSSRCSRGRVQSSRTSLQSDTFYRLKSPAENVGVNKHF